ncbi:MAG: class II glutamine amidotransferase [Hyphomicrobiales bacterium]|jgi:predicted glutamine amidotransferase|nr:class II glutamine amidotransferase [Hyphomicrobiales bacterium]
MCRFLAYQGVPVFLEQFVSAPCHSLVHQSVHATEAKTGTNGDGFGLGWYGDRAEPGLYREIRPAWSDENLLSIARQVRSHLFFAHVRAATGTASTRANCHPFALGRWLFMHNGQIGGYAQVKRRLEALIPDALYGARTGTTDSEALFLIVLAHIRDGKDPVTAMSAALGDAVSLMRQVGITEPLRFAAGLSDGETLHAFRWSSDATPPTLYFCEQSDHVVVASEPVDERRDCWRAIPPNSCLIARRGRVETRDFATAALLAA